MKSAPFFSIIMPVYAAAQTLEAAVDSICAQSFADWELILVEDASPDACGALCDLLAQRDSRMTVIHEPHNGGPGAAREHGAKRATGQWLCYIDADDWIESDMLEQLYAAADSSVDIVVFGLQLRYEDAAGNICRTDVISPAEETALTPRQIGDMVVSLEAHRAFPYMCNKLYRRAFIEACRQPFDRKRNMEDFFYNIAVFPKASGVRAVALPAYHYRKPRRETLASAYDPYFFASSKERYRQETAFLKAVRADTPDNRAGIQLVYLKHLLSCLMRDAMPQAGLDRKARRQSAAAYLNDSLTQTVLTSFPPPGRKWKIITAIFSGKQVRLSVCLGSLLYWINYRLHLPLHRQLSDKGRA